MQNAHETMKNDSFVNSKRFAEIIVSHYFMHGIILFVGF